MATSAFASLKHQLEEHGIEAEVGKHQAATGANIENWSTAEGTWTGEVILKRVCMQ